MKGIWGYVTFFLTTILLLMAVAVIRPDLRTYMLTEDSLVENLSAVFFFFAFLFGCVMSVKKKDYRLTLVIISFLGLLGFLDEISFGERLLNLNMPIAFGFKVDAVHDFFYLGARFIWRFFQSHPILFSAICSAALIVCAILAIKYGKKLHEIIIDHYGRQTYILMGCFVFQILAALLIDLERIHNELLFIMEEVFEMNAAMALNFCILSLRADKIDFNNASS